MLVRAGADEDGLMRHGVGGLVAYSIGCGRCNFIVLPARADADKDERSRRVDAGCTGE